MDKNKYTAELVLRKTTDGKIQCACEGSLADQKDLLGFYISKLAKALNVEDIDDLVDDIAGITVAYLNVPDGENCICEVSNTEDTECESEEKPQTDCAHCKKDSSCFYKDIYPRGCKDFRPKEVVSNE